MLPWLGMFCGCFSYWKCHQETFVIGHLCWNLDNCKPSSRCPFLCRKIWPCGCRHSHETRMKCTGLYFASFTATYLPLWKQESRWKNLGTECHFQLVISVIPNVHTYIRLGKKSDEGKMNVWLAILCEDKMSGKPDGVGRITEVWRPHAGTADGRSEVETIRQPLCVFSIDLNTVQENGCSDPTLSTMKCSFPLIICHPDWCHSKSCLVFLSTSMFPQSHLSQ